MQQFPIDLFAPHYCCSCGAIGSLLCEYCKYDIISEPYEACILCHKLARPSENTCGSCTHSFTKAWCAGDRREGLKELINRYKFERTRAAHQPLAVLLHETLPALPADLAVVPVPTIAPHIRGRGYDQTALLAKRLARLRQLPYKPLLRRATTSVQRGATRVQRIEQAKRAFVSAPCNGRYLLVDDIVTTGATLQFAAQALLDAGAKEIWVSVLASQPLEK